MSDLSVVGLDTCTGRSVHVDDAPKYVWNEKGYSGDHSLVCWHCFHGDRAAPGALVPLQCRGGRKYGKVRTYFAHPSGTAPVGGHHPETLWHANAKQTLVQWAKHQSGAADATMEYWTTDGRRRSDIKVRSTRTLTSSLRCFVELSSVDSPDFASVESLPLPCALP
jgi:hypothetical protein